MIQTRARRTHYSWQAHPSFPRTRESRLARNCLATLLVLISGPALARDHTLYVSPRGRESNTGAVARQTANDGPLPSLEAARNRIRTLRQRAEARDRFTVIVEEGVYRLTQPVIFQPQDSGSSESPIIYKAAAGTKPVISGGRGITHWTRTGNLWQTEIPEVKEGRWYFRQLFMNGTRRTRARSPNIGFYKIDGMIEPPAGGDKPSVFRYHGDDIHPDWAGSDAECLFLQKWAEFRSPITSIDPASRTVRLAGSCYEAIREPNARYWVENAPECLDSPGEWYLDRKTGILKYYPMPGESITRADVVAPVLTELVRFAGDPKTGKTVHDIHLQGLRIEHTDWTMGSTGYTDSQAANDIYSAIYADGAVDCSVENCRIAHIGNYAIWFALGCRSCVVDRCEMTDLGAGGVRIGERGQPQATAEQTRQCTVRNSHIHDIGIVYPAAVGVWIGQSYDNLISHNSVHDTYYSTISVGWTWGYGPTLAHGNIIEFNHLYNIGRGWLSDMGAVYTLGTQPGTIIRNNLIHDVESYDYGGWGLYTDEGSTGILLENNIVYRTKSGGFHQHYGKDNIIRNNIFAFARENQLMRSREEDHNSFTFERNIVYYDRGNLLGSYWNNDHFVMDHNLYWASGNPITFAGASLEDWRKHGHDKNSIIADPQFVNPPTGDFRLRPNSPAASIAFHPIDVSAVGPQRQ